MAWIPYNQRPADLRKKLEVKLASSNADLSGFEYYNSNDLGLISDEAFNKHIEDNATSSSESSLIGIKQESALTNQNVPVQNEGDAFSAKTLRFLKSNSNTAEERRYAETLYYDILLDLWRQHVMQTGETYYPPLAEDLFELYRFNQDQG